MAQVCNLTEVLPMAFKNENFFNDLASRQSTTKMALEQNFGSYAPSSSVYNLMMTDRDLGNTWAGFDNPNRNIPRLTITPSGFVAPW